MGCVPGPRGAGCIVYHNLQAEGQVLAWASAARVSLPFLGSCSPAVSPASSSLFHLNAPCLAGTTVRLTATKAS